MKIKKNRFIVLSIMLMGLWCVCVQAQDSPYFEMDNRLSDKLPSFLDRLIPSTPKPSSQISGMNHIPIGKFRIQGNALFSGYDDDMRSILAMYRLSEKVIDLLKHQGLPTDVTNQLYSLMNQSFIDIDQFLQSLSQLLSEHDMNTYKDLIIQHAAIYPGHRISPESLHAVTRRLTQYYQKRGYINSIAFIPDQEVIDQVITIKIIEGRLTTIAVFENHHLSTLYILERMQAVVQKKGQILNIYDLESALQDCIPLMKLNPRIQNIHVRLMPGLAIGEATLEIHVIEEQMAQIKFTANNHRSPGIGSYSGEVGYQHLNLFDCGDAIHMQYGMTEGLDDMAFQYQFPFNERGGSFVFSADRSKSVVIVDDYKKFDLTNTVSRFSFGIVWPFFRSLSREFSMTVRMERLHSKTTFMDMPFPLGGSDNDGKADLSIVHCIHEWIFRTNQQVFGLRSTASFGLDIFDVTINDHGPDARFSTWLLQSQWLRHLNFWDSQIIANLDVRFSDKHLMPSQKYSLGGARSVRGYRENRITSDDGQLASIQWRLPIGRVPLFFLQRKPNDGQLTGSLFYDYGNAHNVDSDDPAPKSISSVGVGLHWAINKRIWAEINWAYALQDLDDPEQYDIQDDGIHFQVQWIVY
ncbi:MAG: ShlB/FhaC/HecB family hemolysin secretion/activation protein [Candidatus Magnetomorum sp.]|nr:ShlB/FhaC/HecB family hemolysin secretion/activation protein [Candidatus Magnetomorum sp.]